MLLPLGVSEVARLVVVESQAQFALIRPEVIPHEVRILLEINGLGGEGGQPLTPGKLHLLVAQTKMIGRARVRTCPC